MKKILASFLVGILCLSLAACGKGSQTVTYIDDIMSYEEQVYMYINPMILSPSELKEEYLSESDTFMIKITVGEKCKNVLNYKKEADAENTLKDTDHYDKLPKNEYGQAIIDVIDSNNSYLLTSATVDGIYYLGDDIKIKIKDTIELREPCFVASSLWKIQQNDEKNVLFSMSGTYKLVPGEEYVIFGSIDDEGMYYFDSLYLYEFKTDKTKPEGYYDSENAQQVINDFFEFYKEQVKEYNFD